jgi:hypothetical protein
MKSISSLRFTALTSERNLEFNTVTDHNFICKYGEVLQCEVVKLLKCIFSHQKHKLHSETTTGVKILEWNYRLIVSITAFYTIEINGGNMLTTEENRSFESGKKNGGIPIQR